MVFHSVKDIKGSKDKRHSKCVWRLWPY